MEVYDSEKWNESQSPALSLPSTEAAAANIVAPLLSCMLAHGIAGFLKERMFDVSDGYRVHVCEMYVFSAFPFIALYDAY